jgi:hypothetical protein
VKVSLINMAGANSNVHIKAALSSAGSFVPLIAVCPSSHLLRRPLEGAFVDLVGDLSEMSDGKRVKVLLSIMGRQVPVVMPQAAVEVVG